MKLSNLLVDSKAIENGVWETLAEADPAKGEKSFRVCVRGYGNSDYRRRQSELTAALLAEFGLSTNVPAERYEGIDVSLLCETILIGWEGLTDDDGAEIAFTPDKAKEIFSDPDARVLRGTIEAIARRVTVRKKQRIEEAEKN